jgi:glyoxalase family protein
VTRLGQRFGEQVLGFEDPDGLPLEIVETKALGPRSSQGPVPEPFALAGFHSATLAEEGYERTAADAAGSDGPEAAGQREPPLPVRSRRR